MWNEAVVACFKALYWRLGETENLICEGVRLFQSRDMNPGPLERIDTYLITFMYAIPKCDVARRTLL